ncbi:MAG: pyruvate dehydrogenase complex dihydrolipoamide acetyltransferase [Akkermansiaceae bacterium]
MSVKIEMPKLSDTMTEGTLISWSVSVGDEIEIGDVIAEIETDKASMEMEAFDEGILTEILVEAGEKVPVGTALGILAEEGDDDAPAAPTESAATPAAESESAATSEVAEDKAKPAPAAAAPATSADGGRLKVSPLARKIAAEKGVDVSTIQGTGPGGRITAADVENPSATKAAATTPAASAPAAATPAAVPAVKAAPAAKPAPAAINPVVAGEDKVIPLSGMRKIIAERLLTSKQTIPHFYLHVEVDAAPLMELRKQVNAQAEQSHGNKFTFNDFVVKAMINACAKVPEVNASFNGDSVVQFANVGVSIAIAVEDGLVTPVVKNAQSKSLLAISQEIKGMAVRARDKKLMPNEFDGGTITISNLGAWGIDSFDAIVNPPQAAIISVGGIIEKAVVKNGEIVPGMRMNIGMSCDHRVVDGAVAAGYINEIKKLLEQPSLMLI